MTAKLLWKSSNGKWQIREGDRFGALKVSDGSQTYEVSIDPGYDVTWSPKPKGVPQYVLSKVEALLNGMVEKFWESDDRFYVPDYRTIPPCPVCGSRRTEFVCDDVQTDIDRYEPCPPGLIYCRDCLACTPESDDTDEILRIWRSGGIHHVYVEEKGIVIPKPGTSTPRRRDSRGRFVSKGIRAKPKTKGKASGSGKANRAVSRSVRPSAGTEALAADLVTWLDDFDHYEFADSYDSWEDAYRDVLSGLGDASYVGGVISYLEEADDIDYDDGLEARRGDILRRLRALAMPSASRKPRGKARGRP